MNRPSSLGKIDGFSMNVALENWPSADKNTSIDVLSKTINPFLWNIPIGPASTITEVLDRVSDFIGAASAVYRIHPDLEAFRLLASYKIRKDNFDSDLFRRGLCISGSEFSSSVWRCLCSHYLKDQMLTWGKDASTAGGISMSQVNNMSLGRIVVMARDMLEETRNLSTPILVEYLVLLSEIVYRGGMISSIWIVIEYILQGYSIGVSKFGDRNEPDLLPNNHEYAILHNETLLLSCLWRLKPRIKVLDNRDGLVRYLAHPVQDDWRPFIASLFKKEVVDPEFPLFLEDRPLLNLIPPLPLIQKAVTLQDCEYRLSLLAAITPECLQIMPERCPNIHYSELSLTPMVVTKAHTALLLPYYPTIKEDMCVLTIQPLLPDPQRLLVTDMCDTLHQYHFIPADLIYVKFNYICISALNRALNSYVEDYAMGSKTDLPKSLLLIVAPYIKEVDPEGRCLILMTVCYYIYRACTILMVLQNNQSMKAFNILDFSKLDASSVIVKDCESDVVDLWHRGHSISAKGAALVESEIPLAIQVFKLFMELSMFKLWNETSLISSQVSSCSMVTLVRSCIHSNTHRLIFGEPNPVYTPPSKEWLLSQNNISTPGAATQIEMISTLLENCNSNQGWQRMQSMVNYPVMGVIDHRALPACLAIGAMYCFDMLPSMKAIMSIKLGSTTLYDERHGSVYLDLILKVCNKGTVLPHDIRESGPTLAYFHTVTSVADSRCAISTKEQLLDGLLLCREGEAEAGQEIWDDLIAPICKSVTSGGTVSLTNQALRGLVLSVFMATTRMYPIRQDSMIPKCKWAYHWTFTCKCNKPEMFRRRYKEEFIAVIQFINIVEKHPKLLLDPVNKFQYLYILEAIRHYIIEKTIEDYKRKKAKQKNSGLQFCGKCMLNDQESITSEVRLLHNSIISDRTQAIHELKSLAYIPQLENSIWNENIDLGDLPWGGSNIVTSWSILIRSRQRNTIQFFIDILECRQSDLQEEKARLEAGGSIAGMDYDYADSAVLKDTGHMQTDFEKASLEFSKTQEKARERDELWRLEQLEQQEIIGTTGSINKKKSVPVVATKIDWNNATPAVKAISIIEVRLASIATRLEFYYNSKTKIEDLFVNEVEAITTAGGRGLIVDPLQLILV